ncbi:MAG: hypothetical protein HYZ11_04155 [Candidatus Tectomicrobia bacterium]|uniref:Uncharacterized protein n=1 Tax=Tectimicrobiota bacterium TaxID=2528274 RepID=A0A932HW45_UNCTE|nr:hypothetical protein [Candidatus Tectomicrobia bacterium]
MTDITPIQPSGAPGRPDPAHGTHPAGQPDGSFAKFLEEAARTGGAGALGAPAAGQGVPISPAPYIGPIESGAGTPIRELGRQFLALAEQFQARLADPKSTLRDIAPLVRDLEAHRDRLAGELQSLPAEDPGRGLLEEMAALISSESVKFHRGDYI